MVTLAVDYLNETEIVVTNITADNAQSNITMFHLLGAQLNDADNLKVTLDLENVLGKPIVVIQDVSHIEKLVRNAYGDLQIFYLPDGSQVLWNHVAALHRLQTDKGLHLANKVGTEHIHYHKKKMKVYLATQLLSNSVADAVQFCDKDLELSEFANSDATCKFLRIFNRIFDILDSNHQFCLKKPALKSSNKDDWMKDFQDTEKFIRSLYMIDPTTEPPEKKKKPPKKLIVEGSRKRGFLGFLVDMLSFKYLFSTYVEETNLLDYLLGHKLSQDHLERTNGAVRSSLGSNNNPTVRQFKAAMKKILLGATHHGVAENCQVQDDTNITVPEYEEDSNKLFSEMFDLTGEMSATDIYLQSLNCNTNSADFEYRDSVLNYIAGFITRQLKKKEKCVECLEYLEGVTTSDLKEGKLLKQKNRGGLVLPTREVERVVNITDSLYSELNNAKLFEQRNLVHKLQIQTCLAINEAHPNLMKELENHVGNLGSHKNILVKKIVGCYVSLRGKQSCKILNAQAPKVRMQLSKLILFKNE